MKKKSSKTDFSLDQVILNTIVQEAKDGILIVNKDGVVQFANQAASQMFRPEVKDLVGYSLVIPAKTDRITVEESDKRLRVLELRTSEIDYQNQTATLILARDITKQAELEESLLENKRLLEATGETAKIGGWQINYDDGSIWLSDNTSRILDIPKDHPLNLENGFIFYPEAVRSEVEEAVNILLTTGKPYDMDVPFDKTSGERIWLHIAGRAEFENGKCTRTWGTVQDITEKKEVETQFIESEIRRQQLFDYSLSGFALTKTVRDDKGEIDDFILIDVNKNFEDLLNIPWGKANGALASEIIPGVKKSILRDAFIEVAETKKSKQVEYYSAITDRIFLLSIYSPGQEQVAVFFDDITRQKRANEAVRLNEQRYRQLFEHAITGFLLFEVILDKQGEPKDLLILEANEAVKAHTGLAASQYVGKHFSSIFSESALINILGRIAVSGNAERVEYFSKDLQRTLLISAYAPQQGQVAAIFSDVSDQIATQQQLRKREELFRTLFETMSQGVIYHDLDGKVTDVNRAALNILGRTSDEMLNVTPMDKKFKFIKLNGESLPGEQHPALMALRTGEPVEDYIFGVYNPKQKDFVWIDLSATPQFHPGEEKPYQLFTTFMDVTDTIRVQKALEERIKELNCITNIGIILQEENSVEKVLHAVVDEINQTMQLPQDTKVKICAAGEPDCEYDDASVVLRKFTFPTSIQGKELGRICLFTPKDQPYSLLEEINIFDVIAERMGLWYQQRETQRMLAESERQFRNSIMYAPNPIMIHADDGEIITVNDALLERSGYSRDELRTLSDWVNKAHPDQAAEILGMVKDNFAIEINSHTGEYSVRTKSGETLYWYFSSAALGELPDGRALVITVAIDITKRIIMDREKQAYTQRILALREIDEVITSSLDLDNVLDLITSQLSNLIPYDSMSILQVDGEDLTVLACRGFKNESEIMGLVFPSKPEYPNYEVITNRKPIAYNDVSTAFPLFYQPSEIRNTGIIKAWLGIPLMVQEKVIGMFAIDRYTEDAYTKEDIEIAQQFANRAAIAITNASLYEQTKSHLEKLQILRQVDTAITSSQEVEDVLETVLTQVVKGLQVDIAVIYLYDEESNTLSYANNVGFTTRGIPNIKIEIDQGYVGKVAEQRTPIFIPEIDYTSDGKIYPYNFVAEGVTSYYGFPLISKGNFKGVLEILNRNRLDPDADWFVFAETLVRQTAIAVDNLTLFTHLQQANKELIEAYDATIEGWAHALEIRDKETAGHSRRVITLTEEVAKRFGYKAADLEHVLRGVILHDIGKMGIPDDILHKPGPLTGDEWVIMRQHPVFAYEMLKDIGYLQSSLNIPHYHHERWNGSGYPEGLKGKEIPLEARIFAVVDAWDALTSDRPYRDAWSVEKTKQYILDQAGKEFDPEVVKVLFEVMKI
jgi:PAS domain S-box-containing protein/putative nucleotidyltransferase with HDIG domain